MTRSTFKFEDNSIGKLFVYKRNYKEIFYMHIVRYVIVDVVIYYTSNDDGTIHSYFLKVHEIAPEIKIKKNLLIPFLSLL